MTTQPKNIWRENVLQKDIVLQVLQYTIYNIRSQLAPEYDMIEFGKNCGVKISQNHTDGDHHHMFFLLFKISGCVGIKGISRGVIFKILPKAQRTQGIESLS